MESGQANRNITKNSDLELNPCKFHESGYTAYYTDLMMGGWLGQKKLTKPTSAKQYSE